jgi:ABC-2 type transport system ATP-binding protein
MSSGDRVKVRTPEPEKLTAALHGLGAAVAVDGAGMLLVSGATAPTVGDTALAAGVAVHHLNAEQPDLEDVFLDLTAGCRGRRPRRRRRAG